MVISGLSPTGTLKPMAKIQSKCLIVNIKHWMH